MAWLHLGFRLMMLRRTSRNSAVSADSESDLEGRRRSCSLHRKGDAKEAALS